MRKYLNYLIFGAVVLVVAGMAFRHSSHVRSLVQAMAGTNPQAQAAAAAELIKAEQFMDSITGEPTEVRVKVAGALEALGDVDAVKQARNMLKDTEKVVRDRAIGTLQNIGAKSEKHTEELVNGLKDGDSNIRKGTILALTHSEKGIGPKQGAVKFIIEQMKKEAGARGPGGDVLSSPLFVKNGANAESVPALIGLLKEKDEGVRTGAASALGKIGDPQAIAPLKEAMHNDTAQVRRVAIGAIALIAHKDGEDALVEAINNPDDDNESRAQAAAGLGKIATPSAIAILIKALNDDDLKLRSAAVAALARAGRPTADMPPNPTALNSLIAALRDGRETVRLGAAQALQAVAAPEASGVLTSLLQKDTPDVRAAAALALGVPNNKAALAPLVQALSDADGTVNAAARDALAAIGPSATETLLGVMQKGGPTAYYAAQALSKQGTAALPALQKAVQGTNPMLQRWTAVALGDLGVAEARPLLETLEKSADPDVAYVAKEQLGRLARTD